MIIMKSKTCVAISTAHGRIEFLLAASASGMPSGRLPPGALNSYDAGLFAILIQDLWMDEGKGEKDPADKRLM